MEKVGRIAKEEKRSKSRTVLIALTAVRQGKQILSPLLLLLILATSLLALGGSGFNTVPVAPNASVITAQVLKYSIWHPKLLGAQPKITLYSLVLEVLTSKPVSAELLNLVGAGDVIEAFAQEALAPELFGKKIKATVRLIGDERGQRFWIRGIEILRELKD